MSVILTHSFNLIRHIFPFAYSWTHTPSFRHKKTTRGPVGKEAKEGRRQGTREEGARRQQTVQVGNTKAVSQSLPSRSHSSGNSAILSDITNGIFIMFLLHDQIGKGAITAISGRFGKRRMFSADAGNSRRLFWMQFRSFGSRPINAHPLNFVSFWGFCR